MCSAQYQLCVLETTKTRRAHAAANRRFRTLLCGLKQRFVHVTVLEDHEFITLIGMEERAS